MDTQTAKSTPKDAFSHLLIYAMLYVSVVSFIALVFQYINWSFPDVLDYSHFGIFDIVRRSTATLIVVWPVYLALTRLRAREEGRDPAKRDVKVRKWLLHLTLFVAAVTIIIDAITLIYNFLGGELTAKFFLKILTILITTGAVFGYYLWDLKRDFKTTTKLPRLAAWIASGVILATIIAGFFIVGTPAEQRARRFDERRVSDLQNIQNQIVYTYWMQKEELPEKLDVLKDDISGFASATDPESGQPYEYRVVDPLTFELCAMFNEESPELNTQQPQYKPLSVSDPRFSDTWTHGKGRACFKRTIDPELYKRPLGEQKPMMVP